MLPVFFTFRLPYRCKVQRSLRRDFLGGPVVKTLPSDAGGLGLIPGWGTKIPHAMEQLSPSTFVTTEPACLS